MATLLLCGRRNARNRLSIRTCDRHRVADGEDFGMSWNGEVGLDHQAASAIGRSAEPFGKLRPDTPTSTWYWQNLSGLLQVAAFAWEPVDENRNQPADRRQGAVAFVAKFSSGRREEKKMGWIFVRAGNPPAISSPKPSISAAS